MKRTFTILLLCGLALSGFGQNTRWYYNYNYADDDEGKDITYGSDGYIYVAGISSDGSEKNDIVIIKLSKSGEQQWVYRYPEGSNTTAELVDEICYGSDNNIYFCGMQEDESGNGEFLVAVLHLKVHTGGTIPMIAVRIHMVKPIR